MIKFKIFLIIILFLKINVYAEIIYSKNDLTITKYEIDQFINEYKSFYNIQINFNDGLKKYILMINTIDQIKKFNNEYLLLIDDIINSKYKITIINDELKFNILRFAEIKNNLIINYFKKDFTEENMEEILQNQDSLKFQYSNNSCTTINGFVDYKNYNNLKVIIFDKIKNPNQKSYIILNSNKFEVCFDRNQLLQVEDLIFNFIAKKTQKDFDSFIYGNYKKRN